MSLSHIQRRRHKVIARDIGRLARRLTLVEEEEIIAVKRTRKGQASKNKDPFGRVWFHIFERGPLPPLPEVLSDLHFHTHLFTFYSPNYPNEQRDVLTYLCTVLEFLPYVVRDK